MLKAEALLRAGFAFGLLGAMAAVAVSLLAVSLEGGSFASLGFAFGGRWWRELGLGTGFGCLLILLVAMLMRLWGGCHWAPGSRPGLAGFAFGFLQWLVVGVHEETVFRGYPFQRLVAGLGVWPAQLVLGALFAAAHLGNPGLAAAGWTLKGVALLNLLLVALLFGQCCLRTGSLAMPIGVHLGWNGLQGSVLGFKVSGTSMAQGVWTPTFRPHSDWLNGGSVGLEGSVFCTLVLVFAIIGLALWPGPRAPQ